MGRKYFNFYVIKLKIKIYSHFFIFIDKKMKYYWKVGLRGQKKHKYALFEVKKYGDYEFEV